MIPTKYGMYVWVTSGTLEWLLPVADAPNRVDKALAYFDGGLLRLYGHPTTKMADEYIYCSDSDYKHLAVLWLVENGIADPLVLLREEP